MREAVRRLHLRAFVALWLGTLHGCRHCEGAPNPSSPLQSSSWGNPRRYVHLRTSTELNNYYLEISLTGNLLENYRDVYYSPCSGILLDLDGVKQVYAAGRNLAQTSLFLSEKSTVPLERLQHRERRDRQAETQSETQRARALAVFVEESDSRAARDDDADLDMERPEERNSSRENHPSPNDDDPWDVEHVRNPGSPRMSGTIGNKKTVNYSDFMEEDDDEDFATAKAPPNKKARASGKECQLDKTRINELVGSTAKACKDRLSLDDKMFQRDLETALIMSQLQPTETPDDDKPSLQPSEDAPPVLSNCSVDVTSLDQISSDQTPSSTVSSKRKSQKTTEQQIHDQNEEDEDYRPQNTPVKNSTLSSPEVRSPSASRTFSTLSRTPSTPPVNKSSLSTSPAGGRTSKWTPPGLLGKSPSSCQSPPLKSPGLGLRLGLSRLARVKPLHPNAVAH
ncbi:Fibroblast growth factor 23 [Bagarius yarrelli]|uniref:Fibroblast growth factor 23 n=1 Tax=Bagarius yarrelli TaxID=175774 RepID=A0A556V8C6_BAGYA|nr:Fibroblast growth factor 23 [Bagarius yarrelli]